jgi:hypothetical protein
MVIFSLSLLIGPVNDQPMYAQKVNQVFSFIQLEENELTLTLVRGCGTNHFVQL